MLRQERRKDESLIRFMGGIFIQKLLTSVTSIEGAYQIRLLLGGGKDGSINLSRDSLTSKGIQGPTVVGGLTEKVDDRVCTWIRMGK